MTTAKITQRRLHPIALHHIYRYLASMGVIATAHVPDTLSKGHHCRQSSSTSSNKFVTCSLIFQGTTWQHALDQEGWLDILTLMACTCRGSATLCKFVLVPLHVCLNLRNLTHQGEGASVCKGLVGAWKLDEPLLVNFWMARAKSQGDGLAGLQILLIRWPKLLF
jgi:hypothetical protein